MSSTEEPCPPKIMIRRAVRNFEKEDRLRFRWWTFGLLGSNLEMHNFLEDYYAEEDDVEATFNSTRKE